MHKIVREPTFDAKVSIVESLTWFWAGDFYYAVIVSVQIKLTSDSAKITSRSSRCRFQRYEILGRLLLNQRTGWTSINTTAAKLTRSVDQAAFTRS